MIETVEGGGFVPTFSPPDPGFNQREYSESELESNGLDSDSTYPYSETPLDVNIYWTKPYSLTVKHHRRENVGRE